MLKTTPTHVNSNDPNARYTGGTRIHTQSILPKCTIYHKCSYSTQNEFEYHTISCKMMHNILIEYKTQVPPNDPNARYTGGTRIHTQNPNTTVCPTRIHFVILKNHHYCPHALYSHIFCPW